MRFNHAYVNVSICTPSRSVMLTGLYAQNNGVEGFQRIKPGTPTLPALLNEAGYLCGIIGKPLRQQELFRWSVTYRWQGTGDENRWGRDPAIFRRFAKKFFAMARNSNQPFFLMANSHDPHSHRHRAHHHLHGHGCQRKSDAPFLSHRVAGRAVSHRGWVTFGQQYKPIHCHMGKHAHHARDTNTAGRQAGECRPATWPGRSACGAVAAPRHAPAPGISPV